jgi:hypothetical protein
VIWLRLTGIGWADVPQYRALNQPSRKTERIGSIRGLGQASPAPKTAHSICRGAGPPTPAMGRAPHYRDGLHLCLAIVGVASARFRSGLMRLVRPLPSAGLARLGRLGQSICLDWATCGMPGLMKMHRSVQ